MKLAGFRGEKKKGISHRQVIEMDEAIDTIVRGNSVLSKF